MNKHLFIVCRMPGAILGGGITVKDEKHRPGFCSEGAYILPSKKMSIKVTRPKIQVLSPLYWNSLPSPHDFTSFSLLCFAYLCDLGHNRTLRTFGRLGDEIGKENLRKKEAHGEKSLSKVTTTTTSQLLQFCLGFWPGLTCMTFISSLTSPAAAALECSSVGPKPSQRPFKGCAAYIRQQTPEGSIFITTKKASRLGR